MMDSRKWSQQQRDLRPAHTGVTSNQRVLFLIRIPSRARVLIDVHAVDLRWSAGEEVGSVFGWKRDASVRVMRVEGF